jgi:myosin heavy subunit
VTETLKAIARRISETPDEVLLFSFSLLMLVGLLLGVYWYYNRRKMHQLSHQIPAVVVKNYLDSIIQNSSALKSSLFRGGGLDLGEGVPSVVPVGELPSGNVPLASGGQDSEELNLRLAEIAKLTKRLSEKEGLIKELEARLRDSSSAGGDQAELVASLNAEIVRLKKLLESASGDSSGDGALMAELDSVKAERDELKERLMEYEIIEEDLANLKRLQIENEQLKRQLAEGGSAPSPAPVAAPAQAPEPEVEVEDEAEEDLDLEAEMAASISADPVEEAEEADEAEPAPTPSTEEKSEEKKASGGDQKSAEELLSEFEKMLG